MNSPAVKIGTIKIAAGERHRIESEFAAWFDEIEADEQVADLFGRFDSRGRLDHVGYRIEGTVVACCWAPHFGGVAYGAGADTRGQRRGKVVSWRGYAAAGAIARGQFPIELLPGYVPEVSHEYESKRWDPGSGGYVPETCQLWTIRRPVESANPA